MKRLGQHALIFLFLVIMLPFTTGNAAGSSFIPCDCFFSPCQCFIQHGDEGGAVKHIINELVKQKYLPKGTPTEMFSRQVEDGVKRFQADHQLDETGVMDDDTLTLLLWGMTPEALDAKYGSAAADVATVYIPTDGGKKRHLNPTCSKLEDPRKVSDRNAEVLGFDRCKKCYRRK